MIEKGISMKSFADFVAGTDAARERLIRNYKYPSDESRAMTTYHIPARSAIFDLHRNNYPVTWLLAQAADLEAKALTPNDSLRKKLVCNADLLRSYAQHFPDVRVKVVGQPRYKFFMAGVPINVTPDAHVMTQGGIHKFIKFHFSKTVLKPKYVTAILSCMSYGLFANKIEMHEEVAALVDIRAGEVHYGPPVTDALINYLATNCEALSSLWENL